MTPNKVCSVVLRSRGPDTEVLAFEHPLAGYQLVKGSIEDGESIEAAALRELAEESGIERAVVCRHLGLWEAGYEGQIWAFIECESLENLPDVWIHRAGDDGGQVFRFFWHALSRPGTEERWHSVFPRGAGFRSKGHRLSDARVHDRDSFESLRAMTVGSPEPMTPSRGWLALRLIDRHDNLRAAVHHVAGFVLVADSILLLSAAVLAAAIPAGQTPTRGVILAIGLSIAVAASLLCASALSAARAMPHIVKRSEIQTESESSVFLNARHTMERFEDRPAFADAFATNTDTAITQNALAELWMSAQQHVLVHHALRRSVKCTVQGAIVLTASLASLVALRLYG